MNLVQKLKKIPFFLIGVIVVLVLGVALLLTNVARSSQSVPSMLLGVTFEGEYKIADGAYAPLTKGEKISSTEGDVTLRGYFQVVTRDGEVVGRAWEGMPIALYFNHIGGEILVPDQETYVFGAENTDFGESSCGTQWISYIYTGTEEDTVTLILRNPHHFGNETAIDDFLGSMYVYAGVNFENRMIDESAVYRTSGYIIMIVGFVLLGVAMYGSLLHIPQGKYVCFFGLAVFFAGGYFFLSDPNIALQSFVTAFNTTALGLCFMLYFFSVIAFITYFVSDKMKLAVNITAGISAAITAAIFIIAIFTPLYFYDLWFIWSILQFFVSIAMFGISVYSFKGAPQNRYFVYIPFLLAMAAFWLDFAAIAFGWWSGCVASEFAFGALFLSLLVLTLRILPHNIRAAMREKELLAEQKILQAEIKQTRFSIMLSQIQPHFLYNTLNAIYYLCGKDPKTAQAAISSFSDYLRNNLDFLDYKELVAFDKELQNIKTYLDLEKIRFGDELEVVYDIETRSFFLPIMSVQPLVENAVKHGVFKRMGGGSVTISTREIERAYVVTVSDTGVGFDVEHYADDGKKHIGIEISRQRLQTMCDATFEIFSEIDKGTTVTITIPKKGDSQWK